MLKIAIEERVFHFKQPAGTSRGIYRERKSWLLTVSDGERSGTGECAPLPDLSCDASAQYARILNNVCADVCRACTIDYEALRPYPSMLFGLETALLAMQHSQCIMHNEQCIMHNRYYSACSHHHQLLRQGAAVVTGNQ